MKTVIRVARVPHVCTHCAGIIEAGIRYAHDRMTPWDHPPSEGFFSYRAHLRCDRLWNDVGCDNGWELFEDPDDWIALMNESTFLALAERLRRTDR